MAVVDVTPMWSRNRAPISNAGRSATLGYTVLMDGTDAADQVLRLARQAAGVPRVGQAYPGDGWLICTEVEPVPVTQKMVEVTCRYERQSWGALSEADNPLDQPPAIEWGTVTTLGAMEADVSGKAITNTVGEPFEPPIMGEAVDLTLRITRNEREFTADRLFYEGTVCSHGFYGAPPGIARMMDMGSILIRENRLVFWRSYYEVHFRAGGWGRLVLNQGYSHRPAAGEDPVANKDDEGERLTMPKKLALDGTLLPDGAQDVYLPVQTRRVVSWGPLGLE